MQRRAMRRKGPDEANTLTRKAPPDLGGKDQEKNPGQGSKELRVDPLLVPPSRAKSGPLTRGGKRVACLPPHIKGRAESRVPNNSKAPKNGQPPRYDVELPRISCGNAGQPKVTEQGTVGNRRPRFLKNKDPSELDKQGAPLEETRTRACEKVMPPPIEDRPTPWAVGGGEGERETEAPPKGKRELERRKDEGRVGGDGKHPGPRPRPPLRHKRKGNGRGDGSNNGRENRRL